MRNKAITKAFIALFALALCGCASRESSACQGLVYKESGLGRSEYLPCAKAMVDELDGFQRELKTMGDKTLPMPDRQKARTGCLASNARLTKLIQQAGGREKLAYMQLDDTALGRLNWNIVMAQTYYLMVCFYGTREAEKFGVAQKDSSHAEARRILSQLH